MVRFFRGRWAKFRTPGSVRLVPGQKWTTSDPRRQCNSYLTVEAHASNGHVFVSKRNLCNGTVRVELVPVSTFYQLGSKGYRRLS